MKSIFDEEIDRFKTNSLKYQMCETLFGSNDVIPMWVADMDFRAPQCVHDALIDYVNEGVYGYSLKSESYFQSIIDWQASQHNWRIEQKWLTASAGTVSAFNCAVLALTEPGDRVMIQTPVYAPFYSVADPYNRELVENPLVLRGGRYEINWEDFEAQLKRGVALFILCSPHNPGGRVWSKKDLEKIGELCIRYNTVIVSDEIHADLVFSPHRHIPIASLSQEIGEITVTLNSPSKTFNIPGAAESYVIIQNRELYRRYSSFVESLHITYGTSFGHVALEASYSGGKLWLQELLSYLDENILLVKNFCNNSGGKINCIKPEAGYLVWLDCTGLLLSHEEICTLFSSSGVGLSSGLDFGSAGRGFMRMNVAAPRAVVEEALARISSVL